MEELNKKIKRQNSLIEAEETLNSRIDSPNYLSTKILLHIAGILIEILRVLIKNLDKK